MTRDAAVDLIARCLRNIAPEVELDQVEPSEPLADELDLDSMDLLNFHGRLADSLGIAIPDSAAPKLATLEGLLAWLAAHVP